MEERQTDPCLIVQDRGGGRGAFHGTAGPNTIPSLSKDRLLRVVDRMASQSTSVAALSVD